MNIGIIGSGDVGQALGKGFAARGHQVMIGSRNPERDDLKQWAQEAGPHTSVWPNAEAAAFGEMLVLATSWEGTENALHLAGTEHFAGKVVIDVTNPLHFHENSLPTLALGHTDSGGAQIQRWLPEAHVVKAFNTVNYADMVDPLFEEGTPDMFICGNDEKAKQVVADICHSFGWPVIDIGGMPHAYLLESLALLWVVHGFNTNRWRHAFKLLNK